MEAYEYKEVILAEVAARARADALLVADLGDIPARNEADYQQVYAHYRRVVDEAVSRYERGGAAPMSLMEQMSAAYCRAFKETLEGTWMKGRADHLELAQQNWQGTMQVPYIPVEFDEEYWGGDYDQAGATAKIPVVVLDAYKGNMKLAFRQVTGLDPAHIIHWSDDVAWIDDKDGEEHEYEEEDEA